MLISHGRSKIRSWLFLYPYIMDTKIYYYCGQPRIAVRVASCNTKEEYVNYTKQLKQNKNKKS